jgi:hypothetical protein
MPDNAVSTDLGQFDDQRGMYLEFDGPTTSQTAPAYIGGRDCRTNKVLYDDKYIYLDVDDDWAYQGNKKTIKFTFDYYDNGTTAINLKYDGTSASFTLAGSFNKTNTTPWKTKTWEVSDAYFGNRQNSGNDIRIAGGNTAHFYIDKVTVEYVPDTVSVDMGLNDIEDGLARPDPEPTGGITTDKTAGGLECRRQYGDPTVNQFFYFCVDDDWAYGGNKSDVYITMDYFIKNTTGYFRLQYDAGVGYEYKNAERLYPDTTYQWLDYTWHITDADFSNRQAGGADFRIKRYQQYMWLDIVEVSTSAP